MTQDDAADGAGPVDPREAAAARRESDQARRDAEKAHRQAAPDAQPAREQAERAAREAAKEAGRALREAEQAGRAAALARQRAAREARKARRQVERADPEAVTPPDLEGLPRDVAVLWRAPREQTPRRGPRPALDLDAIADAAVALADAEGLEAVSMARVAASLGFTTMSLYRYVASKDEVLMLMADRAAGTPPPVGPEAGGWRERLELLLELGQHSLAEHPWMAHMPSTYFAVGPRRLAWMEAMLAALDGTGLPEGEKMMAIGVLASHQLDWLRLMTAHEHRHADVADTDDTVLAHTDDVLARLVSPEQHPALHRAVVSGALQDDGAGGAPLDLGTQLILDGLAARVRRATGEVADTP